MSSQFKDQVFAITGAGSGIGRSLALALAKSGAKLAISDVDTKALESTAAMIDASNSVYTFVANVAVKQEMQAFADAVNQHFGRVDGIINNAGVTLLSKAIDTNRQDFEWLMDINFWGVVNGVEAFLPYVRQAKQGYIVNMSSLFGLLGLPIQSAYNSSKFAVRGYTEALKMELAGTNVLVACIHPGGIATNIARNSRMGAGAVSGGRDKFTADFEKLAKTSPDQAAQIILKGLMKKQRRILVGFDAKIMDWFVRHFPNSYEKWLGLEKSVLRARAQEK